MHVGIGLSAQKPTYVVTLSNKQSPNLGPGPVLATTFVAVHGWVDLEFDKASTPSVNACQKQNSTRQKDHLLVFP